MKKLKDRLGNPPVEPNQIQRDRFRSFHYVLDTESTVKKAIHSLESVVERLNSVEDRLVDLVGDLKELDVLERQEVELKTAIKNLTSLLDF